MRAFSNELKWSNTGFSIKKIRIISIIEQNTKTPATVRMLLRIKVNNGRE